MPAPSPDEALAATAGRPSLVDYFCLLGVSEEDKGRRPYALSTSAVAFLCLPVPSPLSLNPQDPFVQPATRTN